ncbi:DsbA family protein [Magnetospira thiophila]
MLRILIVALALVLSVSAQAADETFSETQKKAMGDVIRAYLMENPEVILEAVEVFESRRQQAEQEQQVQALTAMQEVIERNPASPLYGNPEGDVTLVEFFDYNCGYCKKAFPDVVALLEKDGQVRYVLKELPILSEESQIAARAALAVWQLDKDKYFAFHSALMSLRGGLNEARILKAAEDLGLDKDKVKAAMVSPEVDKELTVNHQLAQMLGINGTPAFIIGQQIMPGAVGRARLEELIAAARKG